MRSKTTMKLALAGAGTLVLSLGLAAPASADYQPGPQDIVGVGGDTPQFDAIFGADGYPGTPTALQGFNSTNDYAKLIAFGATADGNARAAYANGSTLSSPIPLNPTVVLRAGTYPVQRISSSGNGITALLNDTGTPETINYIYSSSLPTQEQDTTAANNGWNYLHVVQIADDSIKIAADSTSTNAPASLSTAQLLAIYQGTDKTWQDVNSSLPADPIVPELPPSSSSVTKQFLADLKTANGGQNVTLAATVKTVEQNDPSAITGASDSADAIVPFSTARFNLYNNGYFHNPSTPYPGGSAITPGIKLLGGYSSTVEHYIIYRDSDRSSTTPMEPGGSLNFVYTLFSQSPAAHAPEPFFESAIGQSLITAAGATPDYVDLGNQNSGP